MTAPSAGKLSGKVALVTGASRGIGKALAIALAEAGADVACNATEAANAHDTVGAIWLIDYKQQSDKDSIKIRCLKGGKVLGPAGKEIGKWKEGDKKVHATIEITDGGNRNGKYEIVKLDKSPPSYQGRYEDSKGKKVNITVKLVKD